MITDCEDVGDLSGGVSGVYSISPVKSTGQLLSVQGKYYHVQGKYYHVIQGYLYNCVCEYLHADITVCMYL